MRLHPAWVDLALVLAVLAGAGLLFIGASTLPPPRFEPMGSAALPRILGALLVFFAMIIASKAILQLRNTTKRKDSETAKAEEPSDNVSDMNCEPDQSALAGQLRGVFVFATLILYIAALDILQWPFVPVTAVFVVIVGTSLSHHRWQALWKFSLYGLLLAAALYMVMTRFLYVDLG